MVATVGEHTWQVGRDQHIGYGVCPPRVHPQQGAPVHMVSSTKGKHGPIGWSVVIGSGSACIYHYATMLLCRRKNQQKEKSINENPGYLSRHADGYA